ncbi:MAG: biotin carboxylase N-terminal domain-containing protein, partial [Candidatus Limnocylindria bacterium]
MRPPFRRLLIANRGEIAVRIVRACRELGIESVAVYSEADTDAMHVEAADLSVGIGPRAASDSYLNIPAIIAAARQVEAEAVHPGYGFLSENAGFARAVEEAGLAWIGPPPATQEALGNKLAARRSATAAGVPVVPGLLVALEDDEPPDLTDVGFPAMLKAAAGGGGRGMRRISRADDLPAAVESARREALSAFGDGTLYIERLISPARHIEVQLLGDRHGGLAVLGERDCSVQRRHQKLVEETPSPAVTPEVRRALLDSARRVAATVEFHNAATVEFLLDGEENHYFLEMNTRLQVEHGITELVTGIDIVAWQIRIAAGESLPPELLDPEPRGHAIEVRVYAEDPYAGFRPVAGAVTAWRLPAGPGVRVDHAVIPGAELAPEYDPLLAKVMVHAADRPAALARLRRALDEMVIGGLQTDLGFHRWLVDEPGFAGGEYHTGLIPDRWGDAGPPLDATDASLAALLATHARETATAVGADGATSQAG